MRNQAGESDNPYVRSHADTPVHWQLLNAATLQRAEDENKPIFMHIGFHADHHSYLSTQESFHNNSVAAYLNQHYIPIIIDREERPDLDIIYQNYMEAVYSAGGWPLNLFLTPELHPFFAGLYWPGPGTDHAINRANNAGDSEEEPCNDLLALLRKVHTFWINDEDKCRREAFEVLSKLQNIAEEGTMGSATGAPPPSGPHDVDLDLDHIEEAVESLFSRFDKLHSGFGSGPKFPSPARLSFLLRLAHFPQEVHDVVGYNEVRNATIMALHTLRRIRDGGLRDHAGSGIMRMSVTRDWKLPHFEKMVGENALLLGVFLDAWLGQNIEKKKEPSKHDEFADVVFELADYLCSSHIQQQGGGFINSEAAYSHFRKGNVLMGEGAYYLWTRREFDNVVGQGESDEEHARSIAAEYWNVREDGNIPRENDPHDEHINENVLYADKGPHEFAQQFGDNSAEVVRIIFSARERLRAHREKERSRPPRDMKILVKVNGMAITALARTAAALRSLDPGASGKYLAAAKKAAVFVKESLWVDDHKAINGGDHKQQKVLRRFFADTASQTRAFADDYAFLIDGLLALYKATSERDWLDWAEELQNTQNRLFYDSPNGQLSDRQALAGAFYSTELETVSDTILRLKSGMDKAEPSTNAVSASNLFRLGTFLKNKAYIQQANETINAFEAEILQYPYLFTGLLTGVVASRLGDNEGN